MLATVAGGFFASWVWLIALAIGFVTMIFGILVLAAIPVIMNAFGAAEGAGFIQLILAGVLGWVTAYFLIHVSVIVLRRREPQARRPFRSPAVPIPQLLGAGLLGLAAYKIAPPGIESSSIYYRWLVFLGISAAFSLVYNLWAYRSAATVFRPVPLAEVYRETELIEEELPLPVEPGLYPHHPLHPDLPFHHEGEPEKKDDE